MNDENPKEEGEQMDRRLPIDLTRDFMLEKCEYFASVGIWPRKSILDPESWLSNFKEDELDHALYLLNAFLYFSSDLMNEIFASSMRTLSRAFMAPSDSCDSLREKWQSFVQRAIVTYIVGEDPSPTDSGFKFTRKARQIGIDESMIKTPEEVCDILFNGTDCPIIIVDDFIGSAHQLVTMWTREYGSRRHSMCELSSVTRSPFYVCPGFCTEFALGELRRNYPKMTVNPGHLIPKNYSALANDSVVWPPHLKDTAVSFIQTVSARAGIPDTDGRTPDDWRGFAKLGLAMAFEDSMPDATLPLFRWKQNGWRPLWRG